MAERTGCPILLSLWSYVADVLVFDLFIDKAIFSFMKSRGYTLYGSLDALTVICHLGSENTGPSN
jgi:hypothetical protein